MQFPKDKPDKIRTLIDQAKAYISTGNANPSACIIPAINIADSPSKTYSQAASPIVTISETDISDLAQIRPW